MRKFVSKTVLKSDVFSQTHIGYWEGEEDSVVVHRIVTASPWWSRPLAWFLAKREIKALSLLKGVEGVPELYQTDANGIYRSWTEGTPLHLARPAHAGWFRQAHKILRDMRKKGVTHNDLAKPQNWLMTPEGDAAIIDFQLASRHNRFWDRDGKGKIARTMAYEDLRHMLKQKRSYAPELLTPIEKRILARKSFVSRLWLMTGKKVYNFITRKIFNWSDGEGTGDRISIEGEDIQAAIASRNDVDAMQLLTYALPSKGVGLYLFAETAASEAALRETLKHQNVDQVQICTKLPRDETGAVRKDVLHFVAQNQISELEAIFSVEPELEELMTPIVQNRKNLTDRRL